MEITIETNNDQDQTQIAGNSDTRAMTLGQDKEFHLFFSYSSQDEEAVLPILHLLEDQPYNLNCCVDRRDFMLGETTAKNINHALSHSLGTVFFLTPTFLESAYCNHEIQTAFTMYMEGQCRVIPVVLKPCHIPDEFRTIHVHYIDEAFPEVIAEKIFKCLSTDPKDYKKQLPLNPMHAGQRRINGNRFPLNVESNIEYKEGDSSEDFITYFQKREFEKLGIQVNSSLIALLKMVVYLPVNHLYYRKHLKKFFFLSSFVRSLILANTIAILLAAVLLTGYRGNNGIFNPEYLNAVTFLQLVIALEMWGMVFLPIAVLQRFSVEWSKITKSVVFTTYFKKLCDETLPHMNEERHCVVNEKLCFCQYFEIYSKFPVQKSPEQTPAQNSLTNINDDETVAQ